MKLFKQYFHLRLMIGLALGAAAGYAYYHFVGCKSGTCNITSNPLYSTLYGVMLGGVLAWKKKSNEETNISE